MTEDIELTIGSDPEFVIMCGDSVENALEIFQKVSLDMECQCECPHPDEDEINDSYNYSAVQAEFIEDAVRYIARTDIWKLIDMYPFSAADAIFEINDYKLEQLEHKHVKELIQGYYYKLYNERLSYDEIKEKIYEEDTLELIKEALTQEPIYIHLLYDLLSDSDKIGFKTIILVDTIMEFYHSTEYPNLDKLPNEIQYNIKEAIIESYEVDCSSCQEGESYFCTTEIGCDGQSALGELRPKHGNDPIEHFNEILKLMEELNDLLSPEIICYGDEQLQVKAGAVQGQPEGEEFQLGGHIHLGLDKNISVPYLGDYLSFFCGIPLTLVTDTKEKYDLGNISERDVRHKKGQYGEYGNYRTAPHGIEFRMPSSWLVSPQVTIGALSLAYVVGNEFILNSKKGTARIQEIIFKEKQVIPFGKYIIWYNNQNWVLLQGEFEPIKLEIQQMELYPKYKEYIDYILDMIDNNETWHSEGDILPRWAELW